jgi:hypothetical protein
MIVKVGSAPATVVKTIPLKWKRLKKELSGLFINYDDYNSSYENLLEKSKLPSLKIRRLKTIAVETFKIIHKNSLVLFSNQKVRKYFHL